jgi:hypothetical protein
MNAQKALFLAIIIDFFDLPALNILINVYLEGLQSIFLTHSNIEIMFLFSCILCNKKISIFKKYEI